MKLPKLFNPTKEQFMILAMLLLAVVVYYILFKAIVSSGEEKHQEEQRLQKLAKEYDMARLKEIIHQEVMELGKKCEKKTPKTH
jgi:Tfp pilus assembly protein PilO